MVKEKLGNKQFHFDSNLMGKMSVRWRLKATKSQYAQYNWLLFFSLFKVLFFNLRSKHVFDIYMYKFQAKSETNTIIYFLFWCNSFDYIKSVGVDCFVFLFSPSLAIALVLFLFFKRANLLI